MIQQQLPFQVEEIDFQSRLRDSQILVDLVHVPQPPSAGCDVVDVAPRVVVELDHLRKRQ
jgi:hypothetical protein